MATPARNSAHGLDAQQQATPEHAGLAALHAPLAVARHAGSRGSQPFAGARRSPPRLMRDRLARPGLVRPSFGLNDSGALAGNESDGETSFLGRRNGAPARTLIFRTSGIGTSAAGGQDGAPSPRRDHLHGRMSTRTDAGATIAEETSASILRDEQQANNSGLLGHAPVFATEHGPANRTSIVTGPPPLQHGQSHRTVPAPGTGPGRLATLAEDFLPADATNDRAARMVTKMRRWMHDALQAHLYDTAIFWGDKVLSLELTEEAYNDAYFLANAYFLSHQYQKAFDLLATPLSDRGPGSKSDQNSAGNEIGEDSDALGAALLETRASGLLADRMAMKTQRRRKKRKDRSFTVSGTGTGSEDEDGDRTSQVSSQEAAERSWLPSQLAGAGGQGEAPQAGAPDDEELWLEDVDRCLQAVKAQERPTLEGPCLISYSQPCRYLGAQCLVRLGRFHEALDLLGRDHSRWHGSDSAHHRSPAWDGGIKLVSSACHLRGLIYLRLDEIEKARDSFMKALSLDVKNYEAFAALLGGSLLAVDALWDFVQHLEYQAQSSSGQGLDAENDLDVVRYLYVARLPKQSREHSKASGEARKRLARDFNIGLTNPEVLLGLAEELYAHLRFQDAYYITSRILEISPDHTAALPLHIGCMYHLEKLWPSLFILAHRLIDNDPDSACSWYAVGAWYAATGRWLQARRYFSKASLLDPRFAPAWIAFAHSFAMQGESDQAIVAYSTAARKFQQSHLPKVFIGMEHVHQGNFHLADLFFKASAALLKDDPLCLNEIGVVAFHREDWSAAISAFSSAIVIAKSVNESLNAWTGCMLNLAHACRCAGDLDGAARTYNEVLDIDPHNATAYLGLAIARLLQDRIEDTVELVHEALSINPRDAAASALLEAALSEFAGKAKIGGKAEIDSALLGEASLIRKHASGLHSTTVGGVSEQSASMSLEV